MKPAKSSYREKLLDPRWQKKRLEALEASGWMCERCCDTENTLHVHHRQYFKGREPWEYESGQLAVLCADCHEETHGHDDELQIVSSYAPSDGPGNRLACASLLSGFLGIAYKQLLLHFEQKYAAVGVLSEKLVGFGKESLSVEEIYALAELDPETLFAGLRELITKNKEATNGTD